MLSQNHCVSHETKLNELRKEIHIAKINQLSAHILHKEGVIIRLYFTKQIK